MLFEYSNTMHFLLQVFQCLIIWTVVTCRNHQGVASGKCPAIDQKNLPLTINIIYPRDHSTIYSPFRGFEKLETTNYIKGLLTNCGLLSHALRYWFLRFSNILYLRKMAGNLKKKSILHIYRSSDDIAQSADVANLRVCSI